MPILVRGADLAQNDLAQNDPAQNDPAQNAGGAPGSTGRRGCPTMIAAPTDALTLAQRRRFYAEELRAIADLRSSLLVAALSEVAREEFLGPPPWYFSSQAPSRDGAYRTTDDVRELYHDVLVALKPDRGLNNGQPSLVAGCIDRLGLVPGSHVLHVGCGTGYYTAIMAKIVGPEGAVTAFEVDPDLAAQARGNLAKWPHVEVHCRDGAEGVPSRIEGYGGLDAIFVNAAVTEPHPEWLSGLRPDGTLMVPFAIGESAASWKSLFVRVARRGSGFSAEPYSIFNLYPSSTMRSAEVQARLAACVASKAIGVVRSLRVDPHVETPACVLHTDSFCLSSSKIDDLS